MASNMCHATLVLPKTGEQQKAQIISRCMINFQDFDKTTNYMANFIQRAPDMPSCNVIGFDFADENNSMTKVTNAAEFDIFLKSCFKEKRTEALKVICFEIFGHSL